MDTHLPTLLHYFLPLMFVLKWMLHTFSIIPLKFGIHFSFSGNLYYQSNSSTDKVKMKLSKYHIVIYNNRLKDCSMEMYC